MRSGSLAILFVFLAGVGVYLSLRPAHRATTAEQSALLADPNRGRAAAAAGARQTTNPASAAPEALAQAADSDVASGVTTNSNSGSLFPARIDAPQPDLPPATVLENMRTTFRQYATMFGGNPVGTNPEITRALTGDNPKHIIFIKADGNRVNSNGELVDWWGTPYFFHQLSGTEMEIRSAGPDRKMWTADDLVIR